MKCCFSKWSLVREEEVNVCPTSINPGYDPVSRVLIPCVVDVGGSTTHLGAHCMVVLLVQPCVENRLPISERRIAKEEVRTRSIFKENNAALLCFRMGWRAIGTRIHLRQGNIHGKQDVIPVYKHLATRLLNSSFSTQWKDSPAETEGCPAKRQQFGRTP